jgi:hypothetical protein
MNAPIDRRYDETTSPARYLQGFSSACRLSAANQAQQGANLLTGICAERNYKLSQKCV